MDWGLIFAAGMFALYILPTVEIIFDKPPADRPYRRHAASILLAMQFLAMAVIIERALG
jgi:hypothetical protein